MSELDRLITDAVDMAATDTDADRDRAADNLRAFMGDDNASMMGGWT